jgi:Flp pilus assembly protein CpaB
MWKVKRMNPARIAVLAIAVVAGGIAAYLASGSDEKPGPQTVAQIQTVDVLVAKAEIGLGQSVKPDDLLVPSRRMGTLWLALRSIGDINMVEKLDEDGRQRARRGESVNVVRYAVVSPTTVQK